MSTDEEFYDLPDYHYEKSPSNRPRRRSSGHGRRGRKRGSEYYGYKSRRSTAWYTLNMSRIIPACLLLLVVCYEIAVLKGPLMDGHTKDTSRVQASNVSPMSSSSPPAVQSYADRFTKREQERLQDLENEDLGPNSDHPQPKSPSDTRAPISSETKATTAARIKAALEPIKEEASTSSYAPLKKHRSSSIGSSVKAVSKRDPVEASTLKLEMKAADEDDSPDNSSEEGRKKQSAPLSEIDSPTERDIEPPKPRTRVRPRDHGAEPGAGENFWQWFQDTKGNENGGVSSSLNCPEDNKRLCQMVYKYFRKYKIRTVFDASCSTNLDWIPEVLQKAGNELWGFKYYCSVTENDKMDGAKEKLESLNFVEFIPDQWWRDGFPDDTELLFAWDILPHIAYGRVWNFFVKAKKQDVKYILVDNYPGILNDPSPKRNYLNVRKHPFRFPAAKEVVQNVTEPGETAKRQLLFYEGAMLPDNLQ